MNPDPKLSMKSATQLAVFLANRPGALARVCDALAKVEINIHALPLPTRSIIQSCAWW